MLGIEHIFQTYAATDVFVNGNSGSDGAFVIADEIDTIKFVAGTISGLSVKDNSGDGYLHGDDCHNEQSDDSTLQTSEGVAAYVDYEIVLCDPNGTNYTVYVIDVGESPTAHPDDNEATSYLTFDPNNPPPEGVELHVVSWQQTSKLAYDDFEVPCFGEGTRLVMADGFSKAVEDIEPGDWIRTASGVRPVIWVGHSTENEDVYEVRHPNWLSPVIVTKNHGIVVKTLDGRTHLAAAKFLIDCDYGDFLVHRTSGKPVRVFHVMLDAHDVLITSEGLYSESYYVGGWNTIPAAQAAYNAETGLDTMSLVHPRLKRKDVSEVLEIKAAVPTRAAA